MSIEMSIEKKSVAFVLNFLVVMFSVVGMILSFNKHGLRVFEYYTENSNYLSLFSSGVFCVACIVSMIKKTHIKKWIHSLRYMTTVCLTVTIVVVCLVLLPLMPNMTNELVFNGLGLYYHLICPLLSIFSFVLFERECEFSKKDIYISLIPTVVYGVVIVLLNLFKVIAGPYPFLHFYKFKWYQTTFCLLGVFLGCIIISIGFYKIRNKRTQVYNKVKKYQKLNNIS